MRWKDLFARQIVPFAPMVGGVAAASFYVDNAFHTLSSLVKAAVDTPTVANLEAVSEYIQQHGLLFDPRHYKASYYLLLLASLQPLLELVLNQQTVLPLFVIVALPFAAEHQYAVYDALKSLASGDMTAGNSLVSALQSEANIVRVAGVAAASMAVGALAVSAYTRYTSNVTATANAQAHTPALSAPSPSDTPAPRPA